MTHDSPYGPPNPAQQPVPHIPPPSHQPPRGRRGAVVQIVCGSALILLEVIPLVTALSVPFRHAGSEQMLYVLSALPSTAMPAAVIAAGVLLIVLGLRKLRR